jgi:glycosyltransferase involved in cell wall biosynthesis
MRGGEKVLLSLARIFPEAPIFTLLHVKGSVAPELESRDIRTSFVQHLPAVATRYRHYLPLFPAAAESFDLRGFDLVVSSSHCAAKGARPAPGARHLCYCHTPMRYVWDRYDDYFGPGRASLPTRLAARAVAPRLRAWDVRSAARVHRFAANSEWVKDTAFFTPGEDCPGGYDLVVSALAPYKRLDVVLDAYRGSGRPLRIVGTGPEEARLKALAPPEATFLGRVDDAALRDLYRGCRAVLMPGVEDAGIVPLEALACGRPAVVFGQGGAAETIEHGKSGLVFREQTAEALRAAVAHLGTTRFDRLALRARADALRLEVFEERVRAFVAEALAPGAPRC